MLNRFLEEERRKIGKRGNGVGVIEFGTSEQEPLIPTCASSNETLNEPNLL